jgi:threonyl-tRNA synthetase
VLERYRFTDYKVRLSLRGEGGKYVQDDEKWTKAEQALRSALDNNQVDYFEATGEAAFYGPESRLHGTGRAGQGVAAVHHPGRFHPTGSPGTDLHR